MKQQISIYIDPADLIELKQTARLEGTSISSWVRSRIIEVLECLRE